MKREFVKMINGVIDLCYIAGERDGNIYYGHVVPGRENKKATAIIVGEYYNNLKKRGLLIDGKAQW